MKYIGLDAEYAFFTANGLCFVEAQLSRNLRVQMIVTCTCNKYTAKFQVQKFCMFFFLIWFLKLCLLLNNLTVFRYTDTFLMSFSCVFLCFLFFEVGVEEK